MKNAILQVGISAVVAALVASGQPTSAPTTPPTTGVGATVSTQPAADPLASRTAQAKYGFTFAEGPGFTAVKANRFELIDGEGKVAATLGIYQGAAHLNLMDASGNIRIALTAQHDGHPSLILQGDKGTFDVDFPPEANGAPFLGMFGGSGNAVVVHCLYPGIHLVEHGVQRAVLGATDIEGSKTGDVTSLSSSSLVLFDKAGKVIHRAP